VTTQQIRAWILLSVPNRLGELQQIILSADVLNKTVPSRSELSDGLGWLRATGLVERVGAQYRRTSDGSHLIADCEENSAGMYEIWDKLTDKLSHRLSPQFEPETISEDELTKALEQYHDEFRKIHRRLNSKDA
jgi:hypothetical protein